MLLLRLSVLPMVVLALACASSRYDGPIIDLHAHLVVTGAPEEAEAYRQHAADPRLERVGAIVMAPLGEPEKTRALNDRVLALAREDARIVPIGSVHPYDGQFALEELERLAGAGVRIVKLHANSQRFDLADPRLGTVIQHCGELHLAVLLEGTTALDPATFGKTLELAARNPGTQLVLAHMGFSSFPDAMLFAVMKRYPWYADNVWFDVSALAPYFADSPFADQLLWVIRQFPKRVMYGSDFPLFTSSEAIDAVRALGLSAAEQADVFHGNAARLLGLSQ